MNIDTKLDDTMTPVIPTLIGSGTLSTKDVSLEGVAVIQQVADILQKPSLKNTRVKDMKIEFTIENGRVNTKPFDIKLGDYKMNISGTTGLDQTIDYRGKITIPESLGKVSKLGTVDMLIGGTFTSPKVSIDLEALAKNAAKEAAKNAIGKLLGVESSSEENAGAEENSEASGEGVKEKVVNGLLDKAKGLFKK